MSSRTFPKNEHLKSKKQIQALFHNGKAFSVFPLKIYFSTTSSNNPGTMRAGFSVPTRNFKKAVERNCIKRLMRETYRLQKDELSTFLCDNRLELDVFFIYIDRKLSDYPFLQQKMKGSLKRLVKNLRKETLVNEKNQ